MHNFYGRANRRDNEAFEPISPNVYNKTRAKETSWKSRNKNWSEYYVTVKEPLKLIYLHRERHLTVWAECVLKQLLANTYHSHHATPSLYTFFASSLSITVPHSNSIQFDSLPLSRSLSPSLYSSLSPSFSLPLILREMIRFSKSSISIHISSEHWTMFAL